MKPDRRSLPPGVQPYDSLNGARIGALAGGVVAVIPAALIGPPIAWVLGGAIVGGFAGFIRQKRRTRGKFKDETNM